MRAMKIAIFTSITAFLTTTAFSAEIGQIIIPQDGEAKVRPIYGETRPNGTPVLPGMSVKTARDYADAERMLAQNGISLSEANTATSELAARNFFRAMRAGNIRSIAPVLDTCASDIDPKSPPQTVLYCVSLDIIATVHAMAHLLSKNGNR